MAHAFEQGSPSTIPTDSEYQVLWCRQKRPLLSLLSRSGGDDDAAAAYIYDCIYKRHARSFMNSPLPRPLATAFNLARSLLKSSAESYAAFARQPERIVSREAKLLVWTLYWRGLMNTGSKKLCGTNTRFDEGRSLIGTSKRRKTVLWDGLDQCHAAFTEMEKLVAAQGGFCEGSNTEMRNVDLTHEWVTQKGLQRRIFGLPAGRHFSCLRLFVGAVLSMQLTGYHVAVSFVRIKK